MKQLELFDYSEQLELFNDIEYLEWLQEQEEQAIESQLHDSYWEEQDNKTS